MIGTKNKKFDMTEGPLLGKMVRFALPIICTNLLQVFYNSADMFVVGNFCSDKNALGSVGCTSSIVSLILGLMTGLGAGVSVTISQSIGAKDKKRIERAIHTAIVLAIIVGMIVGAIGFFFAPVLLALMKTPEVFMEKAVLYVQIYFCGTIGNALFNFCTGIIRSRGDTMRPLIFSSFGGITNVLLNLIFVILFGMGVEGVAIATIIAQMISAVLSFIHLLRLNDDCKVVFKNLRIDRGMLKSFIRIGIPAGVQGMVFAFSNMLLQGSYNQLGPNAVNANTAAQNVDVYIYNVQAAFYHTALNFSSQNYGAKKYDRIWKIMGINCILVTVFGFSLGLLSAVFAEELIWIFNKDPQVIELAKTRLYIVGFLYFECGIMETGTAMLRSIGRSLTGTVISIFGSCVMRIVWINTVFIIFPSLFTLYMVYPVTWTLTLAVNLITFAYVFKKKIKQEQSLQLQQI